MAARPLDNLPSVGLHTLSQNLTYYLLLITYYLLLINHYLLLVTYYL